MSPRIGFAGGQMPGDLTEIHASIQQVIAMQVKARNDALELVLLESLAGGTCGVLVTTDEHGREAAKVDYRVPYATIAYFPRGMDDPHGTFTMEPAPERTLHALLQHLAKRILDR